MAESTHGGAARPRLLHSRLLSEQGWLAHAFSTRRTESGGAGFDLDQRAASGGGRAIGVRHRRFLRTMLEDAAGAKARADAAQAKAYTWVTLRQIHSDVVWRDPAPAPAGDGLITDRPGHVLAVRTADCVPVLLADPARRVVAAVHAGWRGTRLRIVEKTAGDLRAHYGVRPETLLAAVGPSIRGCCYRVGEDVRQAFSGFADAADLFVPADPDPGRLRFPLSFLQYAPPGHGPDPRENQEGGFHFDLAEANRRQLLRAGVRSEHIDVLPYCCACRGELFFSVRREGARAGRMMSAIAIRPQ